MSTSRKRHRKDQGERVPEKLSKSDVICPVCFDIFTSVQVTVCGHSFCHECINKSLSQTPECPVCKTNLTHDGGFAPNFSLNDVVAKIKSQERHDSMTSDVQYGNVLKMIRTLKPSHLKALKDHVSVQLDESEKEETTIEDIVYQECLLESKKAKELELERVTAELKTLTKDIQKFSNNTQHPPLSNEGKSCLLQRRQQMYSNIEDLQQAYFQFSASSPSTVESSSSPSAVNTDSLVPMASSPGSSSTTPEDSASDSGSDTANTLRTTRSSASSLFRETLCSVTQYSSFQELATLNYADGPIGSSSIVSSIEFDRDGDFFAVGGVTKKVKIFDYSAVTAHTMFPTIHYPVREIPCHAKISSVAYNPYIKPQIATSDYDGTLSIWDTHHMKCTRNYQEHEKRVWSVSYNSYDTSLLATGGDDCCLKLWHLGMSQSIQCVPTLANVCSVRFQPGNKYILAYGSADHIIRIADIRKFNEPVLSLHGHKKAVSYVQFLSEKELVSASTDSELKLWSVETGCCIRTFKGHVNDKNFVGLSVNNGYITCGSENNSFYVYQKYVSKPIMNYKFQVPRNILPSANEQRSDEGSDFVSAVCSRKDSSSIVAANSQGFIKVLKMI